jgi:hypothetical protein
MSEDDRKFRVALENMRYGACDREDTDLWNTCISRAAPRFPSINDPQFRNVSVIVGRNATRDAVNKVSAVRFANDAHNTLTSFVSVDKWGSVDVESSTTAMRKASRGIRDPVRTSNALPPEIRDRVWEISPRRTEHTAGVLQLCHGMPVLLKSNEATEICATNGAEAHVVGWDSHQHRDCERHQVLDTLFVRLKSSPREITLPELPVNVIPLTPSVVSFDVKLSTSEHLRISRSQVQVFPNFAMTDFACQGHTRPFNVVDLRDCKSHLSVYAALSRGSSLAGTLILYPFDQSRITSGISDDLRREFIELEIMAAVTDAVFDGTISFDTDGLTRPQIVTEFIKENGPSFVPPGVHAALRWDARELTRLKLYPGVAQVTIGTKHALSPSVEKKGPIAKRVRFNGSSKIEMSSTTSSSSPPVDYVLGFKWDSKDWSCAYDSLFMIMFNVFSRRGISLNSGPHDSTAALERLCEGFLSLRDRARSSPPVPEHVRDAVRDLLPNDRPLPRRGEQPTCLDHLIQTLFCVRNPFVDIELHCTQCQHTWPTPYLANDYVLCASSNEFTRQNHSSVSTAFIMHTLLTQSRAVFCLVCRCLGADCRTTFRTYPAFFVIEVPAYDDSFPSLIVDLTVDLRPIGAGVWSLAGIRYLSNCHFTSRYVDSDGSIWSHDGMSQSNFAILERSDTMEPIDLSSFEARKACHLFYIPSNSPPAKRYQL